jgi:D-serine deaminase-like pyridoxal phosphate-dependent protein
MNRRLSGRCAAPGDELEVRNVVEFGISHRGACLDRDGVILGVDAKGQVRRANPTFFG